ncbi:MAG TPA: hypothetical protein VFK38_00480 [Candidatus Limnocylindrales bacterium]|nr:hypothetical protein [Candidatus Limnocylindrales bacterium]
MTRRLDPDRTIEEWLIEGPNQLPDHVLGAIVDRLDQTMQRRPGWLPRRHDTNRMLLSMGGLAAAVAVAVIGGAFFLGLGTGRPGVGGPPSPSASPSPTAMPSPSPTPGPTSIVLWDGRDRTPVITVTTPPGWVNHGEGVLTRNIDTNTKGQAAKNWDGAALIAPFYKQLLIPGDPCRWRATMPKAPATTVDAVVEALVGQASRAASAPVGVTVDGHSGKSITLHVPKDIQYTDLGESVFFPTCETGADKPTEGLFCTLSEADPNQCSRWHQGPGQIDEVWVLDVDGKVMVIDGMYSPDTPAEHVAELRAVMQSMKFGGP